MRMGICELLPLAVAVIVAVRVVAFAAPDENVAVAWPDVSLTAELTERKPVSAENVIGTLATAALFASVTVAVIVTDALLSLATFVAEVLNVIAEAVGVVGVVGVVDVPVDVELDPPPPPPQAARISSNATAKKDWIARSEFVFK